MARKDREDITVGQFEKKHKLPPGTLKKEDGTKWRKDAQLKTVRKKHK